MMYQISQGYIPEIKACTLCSPTAGGWVTHKLLFVDSKKRYYFDLLCLQGLRFKGSLSFFWVFKGPLKGSSDLSG